MYTTYTKRMSGTCYYISDIPNVNDRNYVYSQRLQTERNIITGQETIINS